MHCTTVHAEASTMRLKHSFYHSYETKRNVENKSRVLLNSASKMQHILWASIGTLLHISYTQLSNSVILQMIFASYSIFDSSTPILFLCVETLLVFLVSFLLVKRGWTRFEYVFSIILVQYFFLHDKGMLKKRFSVNRMKKSATFCSELNEFWIEIQLFMMRPSFSVTVHSCANFNRFSFTFDISFMRFFFLSLGKLLQYDHFSIEWKKNISLESNSCSYFV